MGAMEELGKSLGQRQDVMVCQVCGRSALPGTAHWLMQPHKEHLGLTVQRCPEHWTEWALQQTREGRTNRNRERMAEALKQPVAIVNPYIEPFAPREFPDDGSVLGKA